MFKRTIFISSFLLLTGLCAACAEEDRITITTYYPSPYGSYRELTAWRMKIGKDYSRAGTGIEDNNFILQGNMGIGTSSPTEKLEVAGKIKIVDAANPAQPGYVLTAADENGVGTWQPSGGSNNMVLFPYSKRIRILGVRSCSSSAALMNTWSPVHLYSFLPPQAKYAVFNVYCGEVVASVRPKGSSLPSQSGNPDAGSGLEIFSEEFGNTICYTGNNKSQFTTVFVELSDRTFEVYLRCTDPDTVAFAMQLIGWVGEQAQGVTP